MAFDSKEKMDRGTILIVDDDDINLAILENIFMPYYNVITAGNGLEGLEKIMADGAEKASAQARKTLRKVYRKVGLA